VGAPAWVATRRKIKQADLLGYSMGGGGAMQVAIRHREKVRKVVSISAVFRHDGWVKEALDAFLQLTALRVLFNGLSTTIVSGTQTHVAGYSLAERAQMGCCREIF
jgi:pimeloyl-ACP methyl ester carboxylesterase